MADPFQIRIQTAKHFVITIEVIGADYLFKYRLFHDIVLRYVEIPRNSITRPTLQKCWEKLPYEVSPKGAGCSTLGQFCLG